MKKFFTRVWDIFKMYMVLIGLVTIIIWCTFGAIIYAWKLFIWAVGIHASLGVVVCLLEVAVCMTIFTLFIQWCEGKS